MSGYRTVVVGTDGSDSSMRAVERAGMVAAHEDTKLIIGSAYFHHAEKGGWSRPPSPDQVTDRRAEDALGRGGYRVHGDAAVYEVLQEARDRARSMGARNIEECAVVGNPVDALVKLVKDVEADLLVVGDVGLNSAVGRLLGSVPANLAHKAKIDILIVHTAGD